ncbi:copper resistance CopC family protein [Micromonospora aurantiaca]|uniref:copper resistance CopC family protein n=1 Tax=Micromonospora aurantiaca (nom. illeg.) TaxID=47850 RepID=UPI003453BCE0
MTRAGWASAVVVGLAVLFGWTGAAWAGSGAASSVPADGAVLTSAPSAVELVFTGRPVAADSHVAVRDAAGRSLAVGEPRPSGDRSLVQAVRSAERGDVVVAYHVVLADGSEKSGTLWFSVGTGVRPARVPDQGGEAAAPLHEHGIDPLSAVLLLINAVVVFVAVAMLVLRPRRSVEPPPAPAQHPEMSSR